MNYGLFGKGLYGKGLFGKPFFGLYGKPFGFGKFGKFGKSPWVI
ncbi:MAG TPA: hypothetical protein VD902_22270 [Symbiobacteriaceae bacterium]|nr:hypothetical protein [Symbiobacteriaceae bacterium]